MLYLGNGGEPCVVLLVLNVVFQAPKDQHPHPHQQKQQAQILPAGLHRVGCASFTTFSAQYLSFCNISDNNYKGILVARTHQQEHQAQILPAGLHCVG
jgi:hypothetical protein